MISLLLASLYFCKGGSSGADAASDINVASVASLVPPSLSTSGHQPTWLGNFHQGPSASYHPSGLVKVIDRCLVWEEPDRARLLAVVQRRKKKGSLFVRVGWPAVAGCSWFERQPSWLEARKGIRKTPQSGPFFFHPPFLPAFLASVYPVMSV